VVAGIGEVQTQALGLKQDMSTLGQQAQAIGQIMQVIEDIADQTNLLALNAAIEAARAGDAGRGFAVVADEVRKLAEKTMTATKEVGQAITGIQQGTRRNIDNVDRAVRAIGEATDMAGKSGEALRRIVSLVDNTTDQVRSIASASEQQSSASDEITRSIEEVSTISAETAQAMGQAATAVTELASQALALKGLIETMQTQGKTA
jgi:methyl-accepting chemotaxis protein